MASGIFHVDVVWSMFHLANHMPIPNSMPSSYNPIQDFQSFQSWHKMQPIHFIPLTYELKKYNWNTIYTYIEWYGKPTENDEPSGKATYRLRRDNTFGVVISLTSSYFEFCVEFLGVESLSGIFWSKFSLMQQTLCTVTIVKTIRMNVTLLASIVDLHSQQ